MSCYKPKIKQHFIVLKTIHLIGVCDSNAQFRKKMGRKDETLKNTKALIGKEQ